MQNRPGDVHIDALHLPPWMLQPSRLLVRPLPLALITCTQRSQACLQASHGTSISLSSDFKPRISDLALRPRLFHTVHYASDTTHLTPLLISHSSPFTLHIQTFHFPLKIYHFALFCSQFALLTFQITPYHISLCTLHTSPLTSHTSPLTFHTSFFPHLRPAACQTS